MKTIFVILIIVFAVLASGCTNSSTTAPAVPATTAAAGTPAATAIPNLVGTWTGTASAYDEGTGYSSYNNGTITMVVTEQQGRIFSGHFVFTENGKTSTPIPMAAAFGSNGKTFLLVEKDDGYTSGEILSDNTIELIYRKSNTPYSLAIDTLKRA